jgi:hypothetical protein
VCDPDDWPAEVPSWSVGDWLYDPGLGPLGHTPVCESVVLEPEQVKAEVKRRKRRRRFGFTP